MSFAQFETLETRKLLCGTAASASTPTTTTATSLIAKPAAAKLLAPSAVTGHYTGTATPNGSSTHYPLSLTITTTSMTLNAGPFGVGTIKLSASQFKKLRAGSFSFSGKLTNVSASLSGTVTKAGRTIKGTGTVNGKVSGEGYFSLTKS